MRTAIRAVAVLALTVLVSGCALRRPDIADLQRNTARYTNHAVSVDGTVTSSWGVPLVPFKLYRIEDGTGELTVLSRGSVTPVRGSRVRVKGVIREVAVIAGRPVGLHLEERDLDLTP
jgi:hypothetical protein